MHGGTHCAIPVAGIAAAVSIFGAKLLLDLTRAKAEKAATPWSYVLDTAKL